MSTDTEWVTIEFVGGPSDGRQLTVPEDDYGNTITRIDVTTGDKWKYVPASWGYVPSPNVATYRVVREDEIL